jgi:uncharacterized membrane protein
MRSTKDKFLSRLKRKLTKREVEAVNDVVEYYDELIDERTANGESEASVVAWLGSVDQVVEDIDIDRQIENAIEKPTVSNGTKALIACLGVLSVPVLIPLSILIMLVLIALLLVFGSLYLVAVALAVVPTWLMIELSWRALSGYGSAFLILPAVGLCLVALPLGFEMIRGLIYLTHKIVLGVANGLRRNQIKKGLKR